MKKTHISLACLGMMTTASLQAAVIAEWTFDTGASTAARMASSNNASGVTVSSLSFNDSFSDFGPGAVPNDVHDGIGFGGNSGQQVMFLHRANYFDGTAPAGKWTSWASGTSAGTGSNLSADGNAPFAFTVTAGATETVTVERAPQWCGHHLPIPGSGCGSWAKRNGEQQRRFYRFAQRPSGHRSRRNQDLHVQPE